ncbi:MAG: translation initiation factor IF-2 [Bacteroidota bacterium]
MEETAKIHRLSKVAIEFNIKVDTVVKFLSNKGHKIDSNPNGKITEQMYEMLQKEFQSEKQLKETSKKLDIGNSRHETVTLGQTKEREKEEEPEKDLFIKNVPVTFKEPEKPKEEVKKPVEPLPAPKPVEEAPIKVVVPEKIIIAEPLEQIPQKKVVVEEPVKSVVEEKPQITEESVEQVGPKILGTIDLDKVNSKKPTRKTPEEKKQSEKLKKEATEYKAPDIDEKPDGEINAKLEIAEEIVNSSVDEQILMPEPIAEKVEEISAIEPVVAEEKQDANFITTQYAKIEGVTILGKIDLPPPREPQKKQPVASSSDEKNINKKKKRKRIKNEGKTTETTPAQSGARTNQPTSIQQGIAQKPGFKKAKGKTTTRPEVSDEDIQKQIRETLARLSGPTKSKASKYRRQKRDAFQQHAEEEQLKLEEDKKTLIVTEFVTVSELSKLMGASVNDIISTCMSLGLFVSINQRLDAEVLTIVAEEFGYKTEFVSTEVQDSIQNEPDSEEDLVERPPIVTVMGHVDHGKTSLLDYIRNANVIAGEAGGITQHIGAYEVTLKNEKKITFLDTPGHEAFTAMRARGAKVTDIAIIVIAADDSVMPQTVEAINHAQAAKVPIIFAINKIDKDGANPEKIKEALANMNLLVEDWGGKYQCQEISAKKGINVDKLLEKVLLESEMLQLKANPKRNAVGTVLESSLEKGRGYVAKLLMLNGSLRVGDMVLAGYSFGRVKAMYNERNTPIDYAGPATPVLLLGLNGAPQAGDAFNVLTEEREAKEIANKRFQLQREQSIRTHKHITLDEIGRRIAIGDFKELNIIIKGDVDGSIEALSDSLLKLSKEEVQVNVIHKSVGQITESDVLLASASNAIIIGFQVRPSLSARKLAEQEQIDIRLYSIIYNAINELKSAIEGMLSPEIEEKIVCNLEVREVFKITKVGTIAGCQCLDGKIARATLVRLIRNGIVVYSGKLGSLKRFKDDVKEVFAGQECGLNIENFNDIKNGDIIEGYEQTEIKRKLD